VPAPPPLSFFDVSRMSTSDQPVMSQPSMIQFHGCAAHVTAPEQLPVVVHGFPHVVPPQHIICSFETESQAGLAKWMAA